MKSNWRKQKKCKFCCEPHFILFPCFSRYMAIMSPLKPRMGKRITLCIAATTWIVGFVISAPMLFFFTTFTMELKNGEVRVVCYSEWPDGATNYSMQEYV
jgi:tachykinin receptor 3